MKRALLIPALALAAGLGVASMPLGSAVSAQPTVSADATAATLTLSDDTLSAEAYSAEGVTVTARPLEPGEKLTLELFRDGDAGPVEEATVTADQRGVAEHTFLGEVAGDYYVLAIGPAGSDESTLPFTVTPSTSVTPAGPSVSVPPSPSTTDPTPPAPAETSAGNRAEKALTITPETISPADFVTQDRGVTVSASGYRPGDSATLLVDPDAPAVTSFTMTETADKSGTVTFAVFGLNDARPETYIGRYAATVTADASGPLKGSFRVLGDGTPAPGAARDEAGPADSVTKEPGRMPRTGIELAGVVFGASLLVVGSATIVLSRRRTKSNPE